MYKFLVLILFFLNSCSYNYNISVNPSDSIIKINGQTHRSNKYSTLEPEIKIEILKKGYKKIVDVIEHKDLFQTKKLNYDLTKSPTFPVELIIQNANSHISINSLKIGKSPLRLDLTKGLHELILAHPNFHNQKINFYFEEQEELVFRHQEKDIPFNHLGIFSCDKWPKQVIFSPNSRYVYIPLLEGFGFQIFDTKRMKIINYIKITPYSKHRNFVEGIFISENKTFLCSQMSTSRIFEFDVSDYEKPILIREIKTQASWSKFIAYSRTQNQLAISNWLSNDVSILNYKSGELIQKLSNIPAPRGLVYSEDGKILYVTSFNGGLILRFDTTSWKETGRIFKASAAMRHAVLSKDQNRLYVSDMTHSLLYEIDTLTFKIIRFFPVFDKANTVDLGLNDKYAFVSCRGPNNEINYTMPSPENGKIIIINLETGKKAAEIRGGNQPTGLDVSPDNKLLCFSNFQDNSIEFYEIPKSF